MNASSSKKNQYKVTPSPSPTQNKITYSKMSALGAINMSFFPSLKTNQEV